MAASAAGEDRSAVTSAVSPPSSARSSASRKKTYEPPAFARPVLRAGAAGPATQDRHRQRDAFGYPLRRRVVVRCVIDKQDLANDGAVGSKAEDCSGDHVRHVPRGDDDRDRRIVVVRAEASG
jgi:hypothetical protein